MKAIKSISLSIFFQFFFVVCFAQLEMKPKKDLPVATTTTPKMTDISDRYILQNVAIKISSIDMSVDANAHYNMGITWHKNQGSVLMLATKNNAWYNNNQMKRKNSIYIYTPTSIVTDMLLNKPAVFTLKDLQTKGPTTKGTYQMLVYGFIHTPPVTQIWKAAFIFQLKFGYGKNIIYKYIRIPEKTYVIGDIHYTNIDFTAADVIAGDANYPAESKPDIPVIH